MNGPNSVTGQVSLVAAVQHGAPELRAGREGRVVNLDTGVNTLDALVSVVAGRFIAKERDRAFAEVAARQVAKNGFDLTGDIDALGPELVQGHDRRPLPARVPFPIVHAQILEDREELGLDQAPVDSIPLDRGRREGDQKHADTSRKGMVQVPVESFAGRHGEPQMTALISAGASIPLAFRRPSRTPTCRT